MKIIGISGTNGSGKDSLGQILADDYGWLFVSGSDILRAEAKRRGLPLQREHLRAIGDEWRKQLGAGALIDRAIEQFRAGDYQGLAIASIRAVGEAEHINELGGKLVWVDADPKRRYERIHSRRRADDRKSYEQFLAEEAEEMQGTDDKTTLNMAAVKERADIFIENNFEKFEDFKAAIKEKLALN